VDLSTFKSNAVNSVGNKQVSNAFPSIDSARTDGNCFCEQLQGNESSISMLQNLGGINNDKFQWT